jgi:hypothetical protein
VGTRCADHVTPSTRKSRHYFADSGGRLVGIVRLRTKATELSLLDEAFANGDREMRPLKGYWKLRVVITVPLLL